MTEKEHEIDRWKFHVGLPGHEYPEQKLTDEMLDQWASNPNRKLTCIFCGDILPNESQYCPRCREYKGIVPAIGGWSADPVELE